MSTGNPFGRMEGDKVKETTANRDTKTPAGTTGMFHSLKNQNILRCRSYLWKKFFLCIFFFFNLKLAIEFVTFLMAQLQQFSIDKVFSILFMLLYIVWQYYVLHIGT